MGRTVTGARRHAVEQEASVGGLLTRLNLLAQRRNADVICQHAGQRWVVGVQWGGEDGVGGAHARAEGRSLVGCLTDVLDQVRA